MRRTEWFRVREFGEGVWRIRESGLGVLHAANIWLVVGREKALLIDAGTGAAPLRPVVERLIDRPVTCLLTHSHYDHMGGGWEFTERWAHPAEAAILADPTPEATMWRGWLTDAAFTTLPHPGFSMAEYALRPAVPSRLVGHGELVDLGDRIMTILHVPGHAPGLLALHEPATGLLFTSDALYRGRMFFDLAGSDGQAAIASIDLLATLAVSTVHPGHGESFDAAQFRALAVQTTRILRATWIARRR